MPDATWLAAGVSLEGEVPVVIYKNGERIVIGQGHLDDNGLFITNFNDSPEALDFYKNMWGNHKFSLPVNVSEVTANPDKEQPWISENSTELE